MLLEIADEWLKLESAGRHQDHKRPTENILIKFTDHERSEIVEVARRGVQRCRDAMANLRLSNPQHASELRQQLEETAKMWVSLATSVEPPRTESQPLSPKKVSEIELTLGQK